MSKKNIANAQETSFDEVMKALQEETSENSVPETAKKEETKTFFTYKVSKEVKIEFIKSKKALEKLQFKSPILMRLILLELSTNKRKAKDILCYKIQSVFVDEKTLDHNMLYAVIPNEYFMIDNSPFDLEKIDKTYYYNPDKMTLNEVQFISLKCKTNSDKDLYNTVFDNKKVRDNK